MILVPIAIFAWLVHPFKGAFRRVSYALYSCDDINFADRYIDGSVYNCPTTCMNKRQDTVDMLPYDAYLGWPFGPSATGPWFNLFLVYAYLSS